MEKPIYTTERRTRSKEDIIRSATKLIRTCRRYHAGGFFDAQDMADIQIDIHNNMMNQLNVQETNRC